MRIAPALRGLTIRELDAALADGRARLYGDAAVPNPIGASIVASDLVAYASANVTTSDAGTTGGAIDTLRRINYTQMTANGTIKVSSSNAGDAMNATIVGRKADGTLVSETISVNGTTGTSTTNTYERLLSVDLASGPAGTVTATNNTGPTTLGTIPPAERGFKAIFQQTASSPSAAVDNYQKFFWKNTNGSLALTSSQVLQNADPSSVITHALAASLDDSGTVATRLTSPGLTFDDSAKNVPNSQNLSFGSAIGVWLNLHLATNNAALRTTYTSEIDGQTT